MRTEIREHMRDGDGQVVIKHILDEGQLNDKCRMYAEITLAPGCSIGEHEHHKESETFYILRGTATYSDNGSERTVQPGEMTFCPDGNSHGIKNNGTSDLVFMALILLD